MRLRTKIIICLMLLLMPTTARAQDGDEGRYYYTDDDCIVYIWQLMAFENFQSVCSFWLYNEGSPTASEVGAFCGSALSAAWYQTALITTPGDLPGSGYYTLLDKLAQSTCKTRHSFPPVKISYSITGNNLEILAAEPIPDHEIIKITGRMGPHPFECLGEHCSQIIIPTDARGIEISIQALSTQSATPSPAISIYIRHQPPGSPELIDNDHGSAAQQLWGSFLDPDLPAWMLPNAQASSIGYVYLAGRLISTGQIDASSCHNWGLMLIGYSTICGLDAAWPLVLEYQNRLDPEIDQAAQAAGIPGQLLKRLIAIESQFWPDVHINWGAAGEAGLGQITHNGADTLLLWDWEIYQAACLPWFGPECTFNYSRLDDWQRSVLMNEIMKDPSLEILARLLVANAAQAGAIIRDLTGSRPGELMDHEDLWKAALINYNAGPGCLRAGLRDMIKAEYDPGWGSLATSLQAICPGSPSYVDKVISTPLPYQPPPIIQIDI